MPQERPITGIDPASFRIARVLIASFEHPIEGVHPEVVIDAPVADAVIGEDTETIVVQLATRDIETNAIHTLAYRPDFPDLSSQNGRGVAFDPATSEMIAGTEGFWIPIEQIGKIVPQSPPTHG